jgi:hypothetical protein
MSPGKCLMYTEYDQTNRSEVFSYVSVPKFNRNHLLSFVREVKIEMNFFAAGTGGLKPIYGRTWTYSTCL